MNKRYVRPHKKKKTILQLNYYNLFNKNNKLIEKFHTVMFIYFRKHVKLTYFKQIKKIEEKPNMTSNWQK